MSCCDWQFQFPAKLAELVRRITTWMKDEGVSDAAPICSCDSVHYGFAVHNLPLAVEKREKPMDSKLTGIFSFGG